MGNHYTVVFLCSAVLAFLKTVKRHGHTRPPDLPLEKPICRSGSNSQNWTWNNRLGKTRDLFKKIRDNKGMFHAKMGSIKERNGMDLTEAEDIKKRWQEYTEELYKKDLQDPDNHDGVITDLEPDIVECEVKWALESITMNKASGGDGIPVELF